MTLSVRKTEAAAENSTVTVQGVSVCVLPSIVKTNLIQATWCKRGLLCHL